jgi:hypothetical protein
VAHISYSRSCHFKKAARQSGQISRKTQDEGNSPTFVVHYLKFTLMMQNDIVANG